MTVWRKCAAGVLVYLLALPVMAQNILLVGDSISAAFGLEIQQGWVPLLQQRLAAEGYPHKVVNASVSGDTTAGGLARLPALLQEFQPELVVIELGGNDGLRALPVSNMQQNLSAMVELANSAGADVILLGMRIPPNYGPRYSDAFEKAFKTVADEHGVPLVPFLLEGVGGVAGMMQNDGVHPTAAAQALLLDNAWPVISQWLDDIE
ncbi:MAG: arylesterase [Pseudomonas sp.]